MSETTAHNRMAALRTDDGLIKGAVAELHTKLAAWLSAMRRGQAALLDEVARISTAPSQKTRATQTIGGCEPQPGTAIRHGSKLFHGRGPTATVAERDRPAPETRAPPSTAEAASPESENDDALLAGLDAETASAIQVKRRLAGNKRSVRELLDEIRSEQAAARQAESERARWWRRGDERRDR